MKCWIKKPKNKLFSSWRLNGLAVIILIVANPLYAVLNLLITKGVNNAIPVTVTYLADQFKPTNKLADKLNSVIKNDLRTSSLITVTADNIKPINQLNKLLAGADNQRKLNLNKNLAADYLLVNQVKQLPDKRLQIQSKLVDVYHGTLIFRKKNHR